MVCGLLIHTVYARGAKSCRRGGKDGTTDLQHSQCSRRLNRLQILCPTKNAFFDTFA